MSKTVIDYLFKFSTKDDNNHSLISNLQHTFLHLMNNIIHSDLPSSNTEIIFSLIELAEILATVIYKTKNMLMIIPIDILRNMPSVYKELDIYVSNQASTFDKSKNIIE